jgi:hypothetical protein
MHVEFTVSMFHSLEVYLLVAETEVKTMKTHGGVEV